MRKRAEAAAKGVECVEGVEVRVRGGSIARRQAPEEKAAVRANRREEAGGSRQRFPTCAWCITKV